ncbi:hypothetical protein [uncultured Butyricimonas sp.]|uniref:hypothetical protein n=1 Tax=uncultured Butyricimonas sp. TaxID=1268785 RepID=UPI0026DAE468|nr:hypothetical protein [uncultured Butyricimonas sp.]
MKNKLMYLVAVLFAACVSFSSCNDDDDDDIPAEFSGTWKFDKTHFVFDYSEESISIPGMDPMTPEEITNMVIDLGNEKMGEYFTGIRFDSKKELTVLMKIDGASKELSATYVVQKSTINVTLNKDELSALVGKDIAMMPAISLKYEIGTAALTLYIDKTYIQTLLSLVKGLNLDLSMEEQLILTAVETILNKTTTLEIGATLKR